ncbi:hypothetical protein GGR50DRAFT_40755 [Xylaria sp. CBS 124048]|nr:hypothetical protein GGR50DRAFT_40755 [Xylaria sp. CBS 124048]
MEAPESIDYKGIGDGLPVERCPRSSPGSSTIDLSDDEQVVSNLGPTHTEHFWNTTKGAPNKGLMAEPYSVQWSRLQSAIRDQPQLSPLDRYYCDAQAHEQLAIGQMPDRSPKQLGKFVELLGCDALLPTTPLFPMSDSFNLTLTSSSMEDFHMDPSLELDALLRMEDLPEWQSMPEAEQSNRLRRMAKLRRRLRSEEGPRTVESARIRTQSKMSAMSNEAKNARQPKQD